MNTPQFDWPKKPDAVLLDLGNVVLDVDFRRAFSAWSASTGVAPEHFRSRWSMDEPYQRHETGDLNFADYISHLSDLFEVRMSMQAWRRGYPGLRVFRQIFVSSRIGHRKPDVSAYQLVARRIGLAPEDIWFLDDNRDNVLGATAAGMQAFRIRSEADVVMILHRLLEDR